MSTEVNDTDEPASSSTPKQPENGQLENSRDSNTSPQSQAGPSGLSDEVNNGISMKPTITNSVDTLLFDMRYSLYKDKKDVGNIE